MRILIFGGNGFLGNSLTALLAAQGISYQTVSRSNKSSDYNFDISNYSAFSKLPKNAFDLVVNCATILPGGDYLDNEYLNKIYATNILGSQNICKWIATQDSIKSIVNCSTLVVVGKPWPLGLSESHSAHPTGKHVLYAGSKLFQELLFETFSKEHQIPLKQIRFSALYGATMPWGGVICNLIDQAKRDGKIVLQNASKVSADFLYIDDASKIILAAIQSDVNGIINGASGKETSIFQIAEEIKSISSKEIEIINTDNNNFVPNRSVINTDKLARIIDTSEFLSFSEGVSKLMQL